MGTPEHQVAVVTGASSGIGHAIARGLSAAGMQLCVVGRHAETLQQAAPGARCFVADLGNDEQLAQLAQRLQQEVSPVDLLVHAAGAWWPGSVEQAPAAQLDLHYRTNLRAPYVLTQALLPQLRARQGQVLFVNSTAGLTAKAGVAQYAASKHALKALADSLRDEMNASGVRVLSLFLGRTASPMQATVHAAEGRTYRPELLMQPADVAVVAIQALSTPRTLEITDIHLRPMRKSYG